MYLRRLHFVLVLSLAALSLTPVSADDAEGFARERLLLAAREAVNPARLEIRGLDDIRKATEKDRERFSELREPIEALDLLVGRDGDESRASTEGLIRQAARLFRFTTGTLTASEMGVEIRPVDPAPPEGTEPAAPATDPDGQPVDPLAVPAAEPAAPPAVAAAPPTPRFDLSKLPGYVVRTDTTEVTLPPRPPADGLLTPEQRTALVAGRIEIQTVAVDGAGPVLRLDGIGELAVWGNTTPSGGQIPLVLPDELASSVGEDFVQWRRVQHALRREALQGERPEALVSDAEIQEKSARVEALRATLDADRARQERIRAAFWFDARSPRGRAGETWPAETETYDWAERHWTKEIGHTSFLIEEVRRDCETCEGEAKAKAENELGRFNLLERRDQQELRLVYITILRASAKLKLLTELVRLGQEDLLQAESVLQRFEDARNIARRQRQLARLQYQEQNLRQELQRSVKRRASPGADSARSELEAAYLEEALALNAELYGLVDRRQQLEKRAAPPERAEAPAAGVSATPVPADPNLDVDPLLIVRNPAQTWIGAGFIGIVREKLDLEGFDSALVAQHYEATDDAIRSLDAALDGTEDLEQREAGFDTRSRALEKQLMAELRSRRPFDISLTPSQMREMRSSFTETARGVRELRDRIQARLELLKAWRVELLHLDRRSFAIRVDRTLTLHQLADATEAAAKSASDALDWLTLESDPNAWDFVRERWLALLGAAGVLLASIAVVRAGRQRIDRYLEARATDIPRLRTEPLTVRKEHEARVELEQAADEVRRQATKSALDQAAGGGPAATEDVLRPGGQA